MLNGTVSTYIGRVMVDAARQGGMDPARLARLPDTSPDVLADERSRISTPTALVLWEQATLSGLGCAVGGLLADRAPLGTFGVWDYLFSSGGTLVEGLRTACEYVAALGDPGVDRFEVCEDGSLVTVRYLTGPAETDVVAAVEQFALGLILSRSRTATGRPLRPVSVHFRHSRPDDMGPLTELYGTRHIHFDAPVNSVTFLADDARIPLPNAQPGLMSILRIHADLTLAEARPVLGWLDRLRAILTTAFHDTDLSMESVAQRMAISPRTLQRRLGKHGTTWREEVEAVRQDLAMSLIRDTDLTMKSVAVRAGYSDARALRRAVHRWHGTTPTHVRRPQARD